MKGSDLEKVLKESNYTGVVLERVVTNHIVVEASINGVLGRFILDTGAGGTVIETLQAAKFNLLEEDTDEKATGAGAGDIEMSQSNGNVIALGDYKLEDAMVNLMSLAHVNGAFEEQDIEPVDGVIGADVLFAAKAVISYDSLSLYLQIDAI